MRLNDILVPKILHNGYRPIELLPLDYITGKEAMNHPRLCVFHHKGLHCSNPNCANVGYFVIKAKDAGGGIHIDLYTRTFKLMTVDHVHPKSKGGSERLENKVPMCYYCNTRKGDKMPKILNVMQKPYINLLSEKPGLEALIDYNRTTGELITNMLNTVLRKSDCTLSRGERELLFGTACSKNGCEYATKLHMAVAKLYYGSEEIKQTALSKRMRTLAILAEQAAYSAVRQSCIDLCKMEGIIDTEIHEVIFLASVANMVCSYVDGMKAPLPESDMYYQRMAHLIVESGYSITAEVIS